MKFFKQRNNILFLSIIFILVAALLTTSYFAYDNHKRYKHVMESAAQNATQNSDLLAQQQARIDELLSKISEYAATESETKQELEELLADLQAALEEKTKLEQEIKELESENEELKVQKKRTELQKAIALKHVNQAESAESNLCYLTFDDGPSDRTLEVLDVLDLYGIKATFFVVGTAKTEYLPEIVKRGHAIGLHSANHDYSRIYADVNSYLADIQQISDIVFRATGVRSNIMRFPGGSSNKVSAQYCPGIMTDLTVRMESLGYSYFDWNVSSCDAAGGLVPTEKIVNNVLTGAKGKKSMCVLMHDWPANTTTVEALPEIIEGLDAMGFRFASLTAETYGFHQNVQN